MYLYFFNMVITLKQIDIFFVVPSVLSSYILNKEDTNSFINKF